MKIYVASSWRNERQPGVVAALRADGHEVYDPRNTQTYFEWKQTSEKPVEDWTPVDWLDAINHPVAVAGFESDMDALRACDVCVLVLPCGRSAHLECGWAVGAGVRTVVLAAPTLDEPELMVRMCDEIVLNLEALRRVLREICCCCGLTAACVRPTGLLFCNDHCSHSNGCRRIGSAL